MPRDCTNGNPQTTQADKTSGGSLQTENGGSLLKTTTTQLIEYGEVKTVSPWSLLLFVLVPLVQGGTLQAIKRKMCKSRQPPNFWSTPKYSRGVMAPLLG